MQIAAAIPEAYARWAVVTDSSSLSTRTDAGKHDAGASRAAAGVNPVALASSARRGDAKDPYKPSDAAPLQCS
ncbi:hypothetical protein ON010_g14909 [Phytophthora cinnamomi]|nr:hypothetical protein ON010_g14909 [Phytophthora cinnamomi]